MSQPNVVIVGASANRDKFGNKSLRAHLQAGYRVFPVNPKGGEIEGLPAYRTIESVPEECIQRFSMYVTAPTGIGLLPSIAAKRCEELWLNPGTASPELIEAAKALGLRVIEGCSIVDLGVSPADFT